MKQTLDQTNPDYFDLVRERTEGNAILDCFVQTRRLLTRHAPLSDCLDVGSASGYLRSHLGSLVATYHGLDASAAFVRYGRDVLQREGVQNAVLHHGWFETFSPHRRFDALICLGLFYVFPNFHWYLDEMLALARKVIVIRSLFAEKAEIRYVPQMPGSKIWTYYNIYGIHEISRFVAGRGWQARWHEDDYLQRVGGHYETAGLPFPFKFLEIVPKGL